MTKHGRVNRGGREGDGGSSGTVVGRGPPQDHLLLLLIDLVVKQMQRRHIRLAPLPPLFTLPRCVGNDVSTVTPLSKRTEDKSDWKCHNIPVICICQPFPPSLPTSLLSRT